MARTSGRAPSASAPLPTGEAKTEQVRSMFDAIAPRYDLINRLMTFGLDQAWRRATVDALALPAGALVLDLACGTGDLTRLAHKEGYRVIGADLSAGMLAANGTSAPLVEAESSAPALPRRHLRRHRLRLRPAQFHRPGPAPWPTWPASCGPEDDWPCSRSTHPPRASLRTGYNVWFNQVVPILGGALSDKDAYRYLPRSVAYLPAAPVLRAMLSEAGYATVGIRPLAGGLSQLVMATRAGTP